MKKIIIVIFLTVLDLFLYFDKNVFSEIKEIDLNLEENEIAISLISYNYNDFILINKEVLLVLNIDNVEEIKNILNMYNISILNYIITTDNRVYDLKSYNKEFLIKKLNLNNIKIQKENNIIYLNVYNHIFCVYEEGINDDISSCNYIYFKESGNINISKSVVSIIYKDSLIYKKFYDSWVDLYNINNNIYVLKFLPNNYSISNISLK